MLETKEYGLGGWKSNSSVYILTCYNLAPSAGGGGEGGHDLAPSDGGRVGGGA